MSCDREVISIVRGLGHYYKDEITACHSVLDTKKFSCGFGISGYDLLVAASGLGVTALKIEEADHA